MASGCRRRWPARKPTAHRRQPEARGHDVKLGRAVWLVSDRTGWWNLYRYEAGQTEAIYPMQAEFGRPLWQFGVAMYGFSTATEIICTYIENGTHSLARIDLAEGKLTRLPTPHTDIRDMDVGDGFIVIIAGSPTTPAEVVRIDLRTLASRVLASGIAKLPQAAYLSIPGSLSYPTSGGRTAHAFFYWPTNRDFIGPPGEQPPLIVNVHGGPTSMANSTLHLGIQYWTSRGFALLDVNYGGSSGFGRDYRDALKRQWGVVDVDDCVNGARYLVERRLVNRHRLIIHGGSAGGYTTLCALAFHDVFKAGASYYGVSDLKALDDDSHKFESQYNVTLSGPYPECEQVYQERSPLQQTAQISHPVIFLQGLDDKVVPPSQSEVMVEALKATAFRSPTSPSRAKATASARRRTSNAPWRRSCTSMAECSGLPRSGGTCRHRES